MKKRKVRYFLCIFALAGLLSCRSYPSLQEQIEDIPAKNLENYSFDAGTPLEERVVPPPGFLLEFVKEQEQKDAVRPYVPTDRERQIIKESINLLPQIHKQVLSRRLIGIYLIDGILGNGVADYVVAENGDIYATLIVNPQTLKSSFSEFFTNKERTCFIQDNRSVRVEITSAEDLFGFFYILLHEATHIIDYVNRYTPYVEPNMLELQGRSPRETSFTDRVWEDYSRLAPDFRYGYKDKITFYGMGGGPKIPVSESAAVYKEFTKVPLASLYSTYCWAEDFAEYITLYYVAEVLGEGYMINIYENDVLVYRYEPFANPLVADRIFDLPEELTESLE